jgi:rod shape-determining protein MreC
MFDRRVTLEWIHGVAALALGLVLLGASPKFVFLRALVDFWGNVLSVPEYPAVLSRNFLRDVYFWSRDRNDLKKQLESLRDDNAKLQITHSVLLAEQIKAELSSRMEGARVTLREPHGWWSEVRINKGQNDGVIVGLPVFQNGFLAGRVSSVSSSSSWVELLTSSSLMIPAVIEETRELGVVVGDGAGSVFLTYVPKGRGVEPGMKVSTALVSEILPPGIPIGPVESEAAAPDGSYATYKIAPGAPSSALYEVSILKHAREAIR